MFSIIYVHYCKCLLLLIFLFILGSYNIHIVAGRVIYTSDLLKHYTVDWLWTRVNNLTSLKPISALIIFFISNNFSLISLDYLLVDFLENKT